jgi:hypothetical protein
MEKHILNVRIYKRGPSVFWAFPSQCTRLKPYNYLITQVQNPTSSFFLKNKIFNMEKHIPDVRIYKRVPQYFGLFFINLTL